MRALLLASAAALALAGCGDSDQAELDEDLAEEDMVAEMEEDNPLPAGEVMEEEGPDGEAPAGPPPGFGGPNAAIQAARENNPRIGEDITAQFEPDPAVAEQRPPNADTLGGQTPAFENQTRAPIPEETHDWVDEVVATGFSHLWGLEFLPDGDALITERHGEAHIVDLETGEVSEAITGFPEIYNEGQGGLFDIALAPDFAESRRLYFTYAEPRGGGENGTTLAVGTLPEGAMAVEDVEVLWRMEPAWESIGHFGGRIQFDQSGEHLFVTLGERMLDEARQTAQTPEDDIGAVVRLNPDGTPAEGNPFADSDNPEVWSYGHRNVQAADIDPETGTLWTVEHGPRGGDELNNPQPGANYGWPIIAYGVDYPGTPMGDFETARDGMEQPVYYWDPVIAPGGMSFYRGDLFPNWTGDLFVAGESSQRISRLVFNEDRTQIVGEEWLPLGERAREVKTGPDGALYVITDATQDNESSLIRIAPG